MVITTKVKFKQMKRFLIIFMLLACVYQMSNACRYTVREIGFSTLSRDIYSFVLVDTNKNISDKYFQQISEQLNDINIRFSILHPQKDATHPYAKQVLEELIPLPAKVLIAPDGRMLVLNEYSLPDILDILIDSPLRKKMRYEFNDVFAAVLCIEGKDQQKNRTAETELRANCEQISEMMPLMPKEVKKKPLIINVDNEEFHREKILMWALGVEKISTEPMAFVLYGRGRIMGETVDYSSIKEGDVFKLMSMIGLDCECGLDRKWMLGKQIPLLWTKKIRQRLTSELGFDVDNPMVLAEMSRILAKEVNSDQTGKISYGPESIDLNKAFNQLSVISQTEEKKSENMPMWVWVITFFIACILVLGVFLYIRNLKRELRD
jgi:hypothetical protein